MAEGILTPCNVACGSGNMTVIHQVAAPCIWFRFQPHHRSRHDIMRNFIQIGQPSAEKMTSCRFSGWGISAILDFMGPIVGFFEKPMYDFL